MRSAICGRGPLFGAALLCGGSSFLSHAMDRLAAATLYNMELVFCTRKLLAFAFDTRSSDALKVTRAHGPRLSPFSLPGLCWPPFYPDYILLLDTLFLYTVVVVGGLVPSTEGPPPHTSFPSNIIRLPCTPPPPLLLHPPSLGPQYPSCIIASSLSYALLQLLCYAPLHLYLLLSPLNMPSVNCPDRRANSPTYAPPRRTANFPSAGRPGRGGGTRDFHHP